MKHSNCKRFLSLLFAFVLMVAPLMNCGILQASAATSLEDMDFSSSNTDRSDGDGWNFVPGKATMTPVSETLEGESQYVLKLVKSDTDASFCDFYLPTDAGTAYTVSFWLKIEGTTTGVFEVTAPVSPVYPDAPGDQYTLSCVYQNNTVYKEQIVNTNDTWKKFSFTFTQAEGNDRIRFLFPQQDTEYTCYFGGLKVVEAKEDNYFSNGDFLTHNGTNYASNISNVLGNHISWMSNAGNCTAETVMVDRNGTQASALKLVSVDGGFNNLAISTKQALTPGTYILSYWMKVDAGIDAQPGMMFNDIGCYEQFPDGTPYNCYIGGDGVWRQFSYTFTLDSSAASYATQMYFRFFQTAGTVYLSDLSLTECHEHSYTATVTTPTCSAQGYTTYTCTCGDSYVADYVNATGVHSYENGICTVCGNSMFAFSNTNWTSGLGWHLGNIGTATVTDATATLDGVEQTVKTVTDSSSDNTFFDLYYPMEAGGRYTVSFWLKIEGTTTGIFEVTTPEAMAYPDAPGDQWTISCVYQNNTVYKEQIASTNDSWKKFSFTFTNPEGGTRLRFFFPYQDTQYTCSLGGVQIAEADETNLCANGDFLTHNGGNYASNISNVLGNHISWMSNAGNCTAETVMVDRNGTQASALKLVSVDGGFNNLAISTKQALTPGEYTLSYWMKVDAGMDAQPGMMFNDIACYEQFPDGTPYNCYIGGDGVWRQFSYTFTLDDSAASYATTMYFRFFHTPGTVYLSDLSLICNTPAAPENPVSEWNLSLGDNIGVNFVMNVAEADVVSFTVAGNAAEAVKSGNTYTISLAAAQMTDEIVISINGEALEKTYSVRQYADYILNEENNYSDKAKALVKEMLNYGAKAQTYFDYNANNLANVDITDAGAEAVKADAAPEMVISGSVDGISFYGASLVFRNKIAVRYYFTVIGDTSGYTFTVNDTKYEPLLKDNLYYIEVADINPNQLSDAITVLVNDTLSVSYRPMNYIVRMSDKGSENLQALMQALYNYYLKAVAYTA